jgi:Zn-dependent protease
MKFSKQEVKELIKAWFFISLAFTILFSGGYRILFSFTFNIIIAFIISGFTVGIAFLLHELAHKSLAQKYGYWAEFRAFDKMLWLALIMSLFGFIIAAPGAVMIRAFNISKEKNGRISLAGPLVNLILALFFLVFFFLLKPEGILEIFFSFGFKINSLLALFNMIPFPPFDGRKVFVWDKKVYGVVAILTLFLFIASFYLI